MKLGSQVRKMGEKKGGGWPKCSHCLKLHLKPHGLFLSHDSVYVVSLCQNASPNTLQTKIIHLIQLPCGGMVSQITRSLELMLYHDLSPEVGGNV